MTRRQSILGDLFFFGGAFLLAIAFLLFGLSGCGRAFWQPSHVTQRELDAGDKCHEREKARLAKPAPTPSKAAGPRARR